MRYLEQLCEAFRASMPGDTVLVTSSRAAGRRVLTAAAKHSGPLVGVRAETPLSLALDLCAGYLSGVNAPHLMDEDEVADLMAACMSALRGVFGGGLANSPDVVRELCRTLQELDMEQVNELPANGKKLGDLQTLRESYATVKKQENLWDRADLLRRAITEAEALAGKSRYVTLPTVTYTALERRLLGVLSDGKITVVPMDTPQDAMLPHGALGGGKAADPFAGWSNRVRTVSCLDETVETHQVFRDILEKDRAFDTCTIVYPDETYTVRLYETAGRYSVPVSMASGVSVTQTDLYAALQILAGLPGNFFDAELLRSLLLNHRCLRGGSPVQLAKALRDYRVGWGDRAHYADFVERYQESERKRKKPEEQTGEWEAALNVRCDGWKAWLEQVFTIAAPGVASLDTQKQALRGFLDSCDKIDARERSAILAACSALEHIGALTDGERLIDRLITRMEGKRVMSENACPGKLLCLPLRQALTACREHIYVVGLGRDCFCPGNESAVLLDEERIPIGLPTSVDVGEEKRYHFEELMLHHDGDLTLSFPAFDNEKQMELLPARVLEQLEAAAGVTRGTASYIPAAPLDAGDDMLREEATELPPVTAYSGGGADAAALEAEKPFSDVVADYVFSASSMEEALRCPLSFYLSHLLHAGRDNPPEWRMNEWLPKNMMGTFCHRVLELYYRKDSGVPGETDDDRLTCLFDEEWANVLRENPPAAKRLTDADRARAMDMIRGAIEWTTRENRDVLETERGFGLSDSADKAVTLSAGSETFFLRGSIDRVDRLADGSCGIVDYKTGDPGRLEREKDYHLQHYLYKAAQRALDERFDIQDAGYLLLAQQTRFLSADEDSDENAARLVEALLKELKADEANALEAFPYRIENGEQIKWENVEIQKKAAVCIKYCRFRALCPLCEEGGGV